MVINMPIPKTFRGYKRENGRVGVRNYVIILPVDDISNACAEALGHKEFIITKLYRSA